MARQIRPVHPADVNRVRIALELLAQARELLKSAGCPAATRAVRRAMKSTEGAQRHVLHRERRMYDDARNLAESVDHERLVLSTD